MSECRRAPCGAAGARVPCGPAAAGAGIIRRLPHRAHRGRRGIPAARALHAGRGCDRGAGRGGRRPVRPRVTLGLPYALEARARLASARAHPAGRVVKQCPALAAALQWPCQPVCAAAQLHAHAASAAAAASARFPNDARAVSGMRCGDQRQLGRNVRAWQSADHVLRCGLHVDRGRREHCELPTCSALHADRVGCAPIFELPHAGLCCC